MICTIAPPLILLCAAQLEAGGGDEERRTVGGYPAGSVREWLKSSVEAFRGQPLYRETLSRTGDELAVGLRAYFHALFKEAKKRCSADGADTASEEVVRSLRELAFWDFGVDDAAIEVLRGGVIARLLAGTISPGQAADQATMEILRSDYQLSPDAVREGARERVRKTQGEVPENFLPIGPLVIKPKP